MISPQVSSAVGCPSPSVPQTVIPRFDACFKSMEAFRIPVVIKSFKFGRLSSKAFGKGVRSRIAQTI